MGKEHCGEKTDSGYGKREYKRECALTLNCRKTHESGDKWDVHGDWLCVDFAVGILVFDVKFVGEIHKYYTYVLVRGYYESVGIEIKQKLREDIHSLISINQTE